MERCGWCDEPIGKDEAWYGEVDGKQIYHESCWWRMGAEAEAEAAEARMDEARHDGTWVPYRRDGSKAKVVK